MLGYLYCFSFGFNSAILTATAVAAVKTVTRNENIFERVLTPHPTVLDCTHQKQKYHSNIANTSMIKDMI